LAPPLDALIDARAGHEERHDEASGTASPSAARAGARCVQHRPAESGSRLDWRKSSDLRATPEEARQNCNVQAAAQTIGTAAKAAVIDGDFVKCMQTVGWVLVDHGDE
jgi:hypothetical protein